MDLEHGGQTIVCGRNVVHFLHFVNKVLWEHTDPSVPLRVFIYGWFLVTVAEWDSWTETLWPAEPKILSCWPLG